MQRAWSTRRDAGLSSDPSPVELDEALHRLLAGFGLTVRSVPRSHPNLGGGLAVLLRDDQLICHADDLPAPRRRFALAHEMGHWLLHPGLSSESQDDDEDDEYWAGASGYSPQERRESEANAFARALLTDPEGCRRLARDGAGLRAISAILGVPVSCVRHALLVSFRGHPSAEAPLGMPVLDTWQQSVVGTASGPLRVVAGPGTGKTQVLVHRIVHLVESGRCEPGSILALTFSRSAAETLRSRLNRVNPYWGGMVATGTLHAYGLDLLRRHAHLLGLPPRPLLLSSADVGAVIWSLMPDLPVGSWAIRQPAKLAKELADWLGEPSHEEPGDPRAMSIRGRYREWKQEHGAVDYRDMVALALHLLKRFPEIREAECHRYLAVLVDESQDLDPQQWETLWMLGGNHSVRLWMVGDPGQSIYGFRGAGASFRELSSDASGVKIEHLGVNYRSLPHIVETLGVASSRDANHWTAARAGEGRVVLATADSVRAQDEGVARSLEDAHRGGRSWSDMAVLFRTRAQLAKMRDFLRDRGIPWREDRDDRWLREAPVSHVLEWMEQRANGAEAAEAGPISIPEEIDQLLWGARRLSVEWDDSARESASALVRMAAGYGPRRELYRLPGENDYAGFLRYVQRHCDTGEIPESESAVAGDEAVYLLTIHGAKGREFGLVIVPNLNGTMFPPSIGVNILPFVRKERDLSEESRLFFVAISRARDCLIVSCIKAKGRQPSSLLEHLPNPTESVTWTLPGDDVVERRAVETSDVRRVSGRELRKWEKCSARVVFDQLHATPRDPTDAFPLFHSCVVASLHCDHPWEDFHRRWTELEGTVPKQVHWYFTRLVEHSLSPESVRMLFDVSPVGTARVGNLEIDIRSDGLDASGNQVRVRLGSAPKSPPSSTDFADFLLLEAFGERLVHGWPSENRFDGVRMSDAKFEHFRARLPMLHDQLNAGIGKAQPSDPSQCMRCPHSLRCPRDGSTVSLDARRQGFDAGLRKAEG